MMFKSIFLRFVALIAIILIISVPAAILRVLSGWVLGISIGETSLRSFGLTFVLTLAFIWLFIFLLLPELVQMFKKRSETRFSLSDFLQGFTDPDIVKAKKYFKN